MNYQELNQALGNVDIYLLDQILKGRFQSPMRILDAGCGEGRNLTYFIRNDFEVWGIDKNTAALRMLRMWGKSLHPAFDPEKFIDGDVASLPFPPAGFDAVICSAVLHFAENHTAFMKMVEELMRVLKKEGILFIRTASVFGMEDLVKPVAEGRYLLPDGTERFLLTRRLMDQITKNFPLDWVEPFKTVLVENARSMSTLVIKKK